MNLEQVIASYQAIIVTEQVKLDKLKSKIFKIGSLRLAVVVACAIGIYLLWFDGTSILLCIVATIIVFLALLKYHNKLFIQKRYCELLIENANNELKGIAYDFSVFDGAEDKIDPLHSFSYDLDLFGNRSFFQTINRTVTNYGREKLVDSFLHPNDRHQSIAKSQAIVKELSQRTEFTKHFRVAGQLAEKGDLDVEKFIERFEGSKILADSTWRFAPFVSISIIIGYFVASEVLNLTGSIGGLVYTLLLIASIIPIKWMMNKLSLFEKKVESLQSYSTLFKAIEDETFENEYLTQLQQQIKINQPASKAICQLLAYSNNFSQSFNILGIFILNPLVFWNVIYAIKIEKWIKTNKGNISLWFDTLGQFDSYVSLAIYAHNHPEYTYPQLSDNMLLDAKELGHPMIPRTICVTNDVAINQHPYFLVVTGANMAGKSTYLRTVGLSLVMACVGIPVCASSFKFYPFHLVTNLRTSDSLSDNESYFFAELKRLKMIIDRLEKGERLFIILDEILKGTNSEDKQKGSIALMKQLITNGGCGIIATHDLILGNLESEYPNAIKNYRFEADITNEELTFTYQIKEGVAQNMNACFLMKKMGITGLE